MKSVNRTIVRVVTYNKRKQPVTLRPESLDIGHFKLRRPRRKVLKLSGWYKTRWDKPKGWVMRMNTGIIRPKKIPRKQTAARYIKGYEMLERYEGKLSCTVLRRGEVGNRLVLSRR